MKGTTSKLIHGNPSSPKDQFNSLRPPVYDSNAFDFDTAEEIEASFKGEIDAYTYSRVANPTINEFQMRLNHFSGAYFTLAVSSGMSAIANSVLALCRQGDNVISTKYLFGHTYGFFNKTLPGIGIETNFVDLKNLDAVENAINEKTRVIFLESITNPQLIVFDIKKLAEIANKHNVALVVDNTLATPYMFDCNKAGVDIEILSSTKAISGGATSVGGAILLHTKNKWKHFPSLADFYEKFGEDALIKKLVKEIYRNFGACISPHNAWLQILGLETLTLRTDRFCDNALETARFLQTQKSVKKVNYPALEDHEDFSLIHKDFGGKAGCLVCFELEDQKACFEFMNKLKMVRRATNFCDNKSLIIHPFSTIYCEYPEEKRRELLVNEGLIRLSVGIEDVEDILDDLGQALK